MTVEGFPATTTPFLFPFVSQGAGAGLFGTLDPTKPLVLVAGSVIITGNGTVGPYALTHSGGLAYVAAILLTTGSANGFGAPMLADDASGGTITANAFNVRSTAVVTNGFTVRVNYLVVGQR